jgi:hypothetical protein
VVFEDVPQVIQAWRTHFASLQIKSQSNAEKNWEIERAALLSAMAVHLGYSNIPHSELLRDYYPEGHDNQLKDDIDFRQAASTFLKSGAALHELIIQNYVPPKNDDQKDEDKPQS